MLKGRYKSRQRPQNFWLDPGHPLSKGCEFAMLGRFPGSINAVDSSPKKNNGTLTNFNFDSTDGWRYVPELGRWGVAFAGVTDFVSLPASISVVEGTPFTVAFWVRVTAYAPNTYPVAVALTSAGGAADAWMIGLNLSDASYRGVFFGAQTWAQGHAGSGDWIGAWKHVAIDYNGGLKSAIENFRLWIDAIPQTPLVTGGLSLTNASSLSAPSGVAQILRLNGRVADPTVIVRSQHSDSQIATLANRSDPLLDGWVVPVHRYVRGIGQGVSYFPRRRMQQYRQGPALRMSL